VGLNPIDAAMIERIPQKTLDDCTTCVVAMVMGYTYEQVLEDTRPYARRNADGKYLEWWVEYIQHKGLTVAFRPFMEAYDLWKSPGQTVGILGMTIPHMQRRHVVAIDAEGVIDPADGRPNRMHLAEYVASQLAIGIVIDTEFLAIYRK
jgi:hypothetical protein